MAQVVLVEARAVQAADQAVLAADWAARVVAGLVGVITVTTSLAGNHHATISNVWPLPVCLRHSRDNVR